MEDKPSAVTPERFATGMTFEQSIASVGPPETLKREGAQGEARRDWSEYLREAYERARLTDAQTAAIRWLAAQPNGPAKVLVISEEWSSDCRRDLPMLARLAEAGGIELRVFRSEEHTSELQSRLHLVCRLLLEKKKNRRVMTSLWNYRSLSLA